MSLWVTLAGAISTAGLLNTLLCTTSRALVCIENDEFCIKNDEFWIKNDEFRINNDGL